MHYIAWRISEGAVPYRDLFDMNFPGVYLVHGLALRLFGAGDTSWRAFDLAWLAAASLAAAALAAPWGRLAAAGAGLFFAAYHLAAGTARFPLVSVPPAGGARRRSLGRAPRRAYEPRVGRARARRRHHGQASRGALRRRPARARRRRRARQGAARRRAGRGLRGG